jgi:hypothetical protein
VWSKRTLLAPVVGAVVITGAMQATAETPERGFFGHGIKHPDYSGRFIAPEGGKIGRLLIKVTAQTNQGVPVNGLFQPKELTVTCVGGLPAERHYGFSPYQIHFRDHGRILEGQHYSIDQDGYETVLIIRGHVNREQSRIRGDLILLDNPGQVGNQPYCSTQGERPWVANQVRG